MENKLQSINFQDFIDLNTKNVELFCDTLSKIIADSIVNKTTESISQNLSDITRNYEKIYNILKLDDSKNALCYYFGRISSLTDLTLTISSEEITNEILKKTLNSYALLLPTLNVISKYGTISGSNLKKELNLKNYSSLSNFIKRISKYKLIETNKIGTSNYYTLSLLGKQLLESEHRRINCNHGELKIKFSDFIYFLNGIPEELEEVDPNAENIIHNYIRFVLNQKEKRLLKQKLDTIFHTRDKFVYNALQNNLKETTLTENNISIESYDRKNANNIYGYDCVVIDAY